jgi:hypothetical protein
MTRAALAEPPAVKDTEETVDEYVRKGRELAGAGDFRGAYAFFAKVWKLKKSYDIAGNLAVVEMRLGLMRDAAEHFAFCEENFPMITDKDLAEKREILRKSARAARAEVGTAHIRVMRDDRGSAEGAQVLVDGRSVGLVDAAGKVKQSLLSSKDVFVEAGNRTFRATLADCKDGVATLTAAKGQTVEVGLLLSCRRELSMPILFTGVGLTAAALGLGIGATLHSNASSEEAGALWADVTERGAQRGPCFFSENSEKCGALDSSLRDTRVFRGLAIGGFVAANAFAAATVLYAVLGRGSRAPASQPSVQVGGGVAPGGGGLLVRGSF